MKSTNPRACQYRYYSHGQVEQTHHRGLGGVRGWRDRDFLGDILAARQRLVAYPEEMSYDLEAVVACAT
jgi:hypothetical protein